MITHTIVKYKPKVPVPKKETQLQRPNFHGKIGSLEHKRHILERAITNCKLEKGDIVLYKKNGYSISDIYTVNDLEYINWVGLSPQFVELVSLHDGELILVNPGECKRDRKR